MRRRSTGRTSIASALRGSLTSTLDQWLRNRIQVDAHIKEKQVSRRVSSRRGGNDFFSGIPGASITLTADTSFASSMRAISYSCVRSSQCFLNSHAPVEIRVGDGKPWKLAQWRIELPFVVATDGVCPGIVMHLLRGQRC